MGAEQHASEGKTQSLGIALGSWLISDIWKAAGGGQKVKYDCAIYIQQRCRIQGLRYRCSRLSICTQFTVGA